MELLSPVLAVLLAVGPASTSPSPEAEVLEPAEPEPIDDDLPPEPALPPEPELPQPVPAPSSPAPTTSATAATGSAQYAQIEGRDASDDTSPKNEAQNEAETKTKKKKAKKKHDVDVGLRIIAGFRARATHPSAEQPEPAETTSKLQLRQARVKVEARYTKLLRARASFELADLLGTVRPGEVIRDAYANVRLHPAAQLRVGQFKRPYSHLELRSVGRIPFIGRGLYNERAIEDLGWGDRAVGGAVWGKLEPQRPGLHRVEWHAMVSNQPIERAITDDPDGVDVHARVAYDPTAWLSIGAGGAFKHVEDPLGARRQVFGAGGDVTAQWRGLYASLELDAAQDWTFADESPWVLGALGYVSYEWTVAKHVRLQPTVAAELLDANLSYAQSEALRLVGTFNVLWRKYLRVLPQVELVRPRAPVTGVNPAVASETYGVWISVQL